jgi:hypothetical protein
MRQAGCGAQQAGRDTGTSDTKSAAPIRKPGSDSPIGASKSFRQGTLPCDKPLQQRCCSLFSLRFRFPLQGSSWTSSRRAAAKITRAFSGRIARGSRRLQLLSIFQVVVPGCFHSFQNLIVGPSPPKPIRPNPNRGLPRRTRLRCLKTSTPCPCQHSKTGLSMTIGLAMRAPLKQAFSRGRGCPHSMAFPSKFLATDMELPRQPRSVLRLEGRRHECFSWLTAYPCRPQTRH